MLDHVQEIIDKWKAIDDEIWAKIICMERNRRIAKAYARKHTLTVNGSEEEYLDGTTLGLNSFDNPERDAKTRHIKQYIGQGIRIKITQEGDILVKRMSKANVFVHKLDSGTYASSRQQQAAGGKISNSSSDLYAMNSDTGDLYGIIRQQQALLKPGYNRIRANQDTTTDYESSDWLGRAANTRTQLAPAAQSKSQTANSSGVSSASSSGGISFTAASKLRSSSKAELAAKQPTRPMGGASSFAITTRSIPLEHNRPVKIFDMSKFKAILERESRKPCPNRKRLQSQCISIISFVLDDNKMLNLPSWILIINIVAIDLLKTEIGLIDPHDLLGPMNSLPPPEQFRHEPNAASFGGSEKGNTEAKSRRAAENSNMFMRNRRLGALICADHGAASTPLSVGGRNGTRQNQFLAAKRAFANAAALGAYNGDYFREKFLAQELSGKVSASRARYLDHVAGQEGQRAAQRQSEGEGAPEQAAKSEAQQSSASSGFNSHCSSQNDSSAASSSSNIASNNSAGPEGCGLDADQEVAMIPPPPAPPKSLHKVMQMRTASDLGPELMQRKWAIESQAKQQVEAGEQNERPQSVDDGDKRTEAAHLGEGEVLPASLAMSPRGKRPPKLPHRVTAEMSEPIPIPASPTSSGATPSGKANLILVSPTGLSPPMPKRKAATAANPLAGDCDAGEVPEFCTIKHIDENGHCKVLKDCQRPARLPAGIPAYAQLAPPATQRHILRYLMMATRSKLPDAANGGAEPTGAAHAQAAAAAAARYRRPLPILPCQSKQPNQNANLSYHQGADEQSDESLYYCGMQARVPLRAAQQLAPALARNQLLRHQQQQRTAANLLSEFKYNLRRSQQQHLQHHQHHLSPYGGPELPVSGNEPARLVAVQASASPLMKFFKPAPGKLGRPADERALIAAADSSSSLFNGTNPKSKSRFLSADNLNQTEAGQVKSSSSTSTILAQVGGLLKRNKAKKRTTTQSASSILGPGTGQSAINLAP